MTLPILQALGNYLNIYLVSFFLDGLSGRDSAHATELQKTKGTGQFLKQHQETFQAIKLIKKTSWLLSLLTL